MIQRLLFIAQLAILPALHAQDTLMQYPGAYGTYNILIREGSDSTLYSYYADSTLESEKKYVNGKIGSNTRYYPGGKIMWTQERLNNLANGEMKFYGEKGTHLATFEMTNDTITDTLYLNKNKHFIFGRFTYYSVVYGGMEREDGQSNISGGSGVRMHQKMYLVKLDPAKSAQKKYREFYTDYNGYYFCEVVSGKYGIFPDYFPIDKVSATMGSPESGIHRSMESSWNIDAPIDMTIDNYRYLLLHFHSVGYAP